MVVTLVLLMPTGEWMKVEGTTEDTDLRLPVVVKVTKTHTDVDV